MGHVTFSKSLSGTKCQANVLQFCGCPPLFLSYFLGWKWWSDIFVARNCKYLLLLFLKSIETPKYQKAFEGPPQNTPERLRNKSAIFSVVKGWSNVLTEMIGKMILLVSFTVEWIDGCYIEKLKHGIYFFVQNDRMSSIGKFSNNKYCNSTCAIAFITVT